MHLSMQSLKVPHDPSATGQFGNMQWVLVYSSMEEAFKISIQAFKSMQGSRNAGLFII